MEAPRQFTVVPRHKAREWDFSASERRNVVIQYEAVDSPVAWAAQIHGCSILNVSTKAEGAVLSSADALCQLLPACHAQLCEQVREESLGGQKSYDITTNRRIHLPPLLSPAGTVRLLSCMGQAAPSCRRSIRQPWHYKHSQVGMEGYGLAFPMGTLLQASTGLSLLKEIRGNLSKEEAKSFDGDAVREVWRLPEPSENLLATLAALDKMMPTRLAEALLKSSLGTMPPVTRQVQAQLLNAMFFLLFSLSLSLSRSVSCSFCMLSQTVHVF